jgi:hypothetical protein
MPGGPGRWLREVLAAGEPIGEVAGDLGKRFELRGGHGAKNHFVAMFFDQHLGALKSKGLREADGLTPTVLEDFCSRHSYTV